MLTINPHSGVPIYRQVVEQIQRLIVSGQLKEGENLPSVREIAETFTVNPMTISKAYSLLEAEGLLVRQRGKPMQVAPLKEKSDVDDKLSQLNPLIDNLSLAAQQLDVSSDELIAWMRERLNQ